MNCEQRRDLMPLLLVDALDPVEAAALRSHISAGCPRCSAYLAEADATLALLPFALEPQAPRVEARGLLLSRIGVASDAVNEPATVGAPGDAETHRQKVLKFPRWARVILPPALAACLTFVATAWGMLDSMKKQRAEYATALKGHSEYIQALHEQNAAMNKTVRTMSTRVMETDRSIEDVLKARKFITLEGMSNQPKAFARAWFDPQRNAWHFRAFNLAQLGPKEAYELWFITPYGRVVPASTFRPDERGEAYLVTRLPADVGPVGAAKVTDEPSVGTFQPTGTVHLAGKVE